MLINTFLASVTILLGFFALAFSSPGEISVEPVLVGAGIVALLIVSQIVLWAFEIRAGNIFLAVSFLTAVGLLVQYRLNPAVALLQLKWAALSFPVALGFMAFFPDYRKLAEYKYTFAFLGLLLLLSPILFGVEKNGAKLWLRFGSLSFQPSELAKIFLAVFFAGYLTDRYKLLSGNFKKVGFLELPNIRYLGPLAIMWLVSLLVLVLEKDLGGSLLFFSLFVSMIYIATGKTIYPLSGLVMFVIGCAISYALFPHLQTRIDMWLNPWTDTAGKGYQIVQSIFSFSAGGLWGSGLGYGTPGLIPAATTDFIFSAVAEELGLIGSAGVLLIILILMTSGFRISLGIGNTFGKLLCSGLILSYGLQSVVIILGVMKMIPLTGITLPFISYGGSSLLSNLLLFSLLIKVLTQENG